MVQWQIRFDRASKALSEPRRPNENAAQFRERQQTMAQAMRHIQSVKPTPTSQPQGKMNTGQAAPAPSNKGLYGYITDTLRNAIGG